MIAKELMLTNRSMPRAVVIPELAYPDVSEAVKWLCHVFGFRQRLIIGNHRVQLLVGKDGAVVVVQSSAGDVQDARHSIMVRVPEVGEHHATSKHRGARILKPLADTIPTAKGNIRLRTSVATSGGSPRASQMLTRHNGAANSLRMKAEQ
jgi:hypothetical protein